jgi:signal-transduction protein with cAMP-binding, CBS, and nucleotidyltransferase domain
VLFSVAVVAHFFCLDLTSTQFLWEEAFEGSLVPLDPHGDSAPHITAYAHAARKICAQKVADVMSDNDLYTVSPETTMRHAAELMTRTKLHHLPVVDGTTNALVGILTSTDVMKDMLHVVRHLPASETDVANGEDTVVTNPLSP